MGEFRPLLGGSDCSGQTRSPHGCLAFVGLHDLQTVSAFALFPLWSLIKMLNGTESHGTRSLNPVNVLLSEVFCDVLV